MKFSMVSAASVFFFFFGLYVKCDVKIVVILCETCQAHCSAPPIVHYSLWLFTQSNNVAPSC